MQQRDDLPAIWRKPELKELQHYVYEAHTASETERAERWRDAELVDGAHWTSERWDAALSAGLDPLTINRVFPVINLLLGHQAITRRDIVAKGRSTKDGTLSELMTECIKYVLDQSQGHFRISDAFKDAVGSGWGCLYCGRSMDPRKERLKIGHRSWVNIFWDPFSSPWLDPDTGCRYAFEHRWMHLSTLQSLYPSKAKDIEEQFAAYTSGDNGGWHADYNQDHATDIEDERYGTIAASGWVQSTTRRVRPVEMWYPVHKVGLFALFADGKCMEIGDDTPASEVYQIMQSAQELRRAVVPKMHTTTFLGDLVLHDGPSPFHHDLYPFVPFVAYTNRWGYPYGVPRQLRGQQEEVNQHRSAVLALLRNRRALVEHDAADDHQALFEELNKYNGMAMLRPGGLGKIKLDEHLPLAQMRSAMTQQAESEIQQISGANAERMGYSSNAQSQVAIQSRAEHSNTVTATLFDNLKRSCTILGNMLCAEIKGEYTAPKVLRITDSMTKADRFVVINEPRQTPYGIEIVNNISQGTYDIIVTDAPLTDTAREQSANILMTTIQKAPPEAIPQLILVWLELVDMPNKDALLAKIRPLMGEAPDDQDKSPEQIKAEYEAKAEQEQAKAQADEQHEAAVRALELEKLRAEVMEIMARAGKYGADAQARPVEAGAKMLDADTRRGKTEIDCFCEGAELGAKMRGGWTPQQQARAQAPVYAPEVPAQGGMYR